MTEDSSDSTQASDLSAAPSRWGDAAALVLTGATVMDFLQGYLTCDTATVQVGQSQAMALCNVQGRAVASGWLLAMAPDSAALIVHASVVDRLAEFLKPYVTFSRCVLDAQPRTLQLSHEALPGFAPLLGDWHCAIRPEPTTEAQDASAEMQCALVARQFVLLQRSVSERFLPQMLGLDAQDALSFDKGCYLGQEIVARARFRGAVKRGLIARSWSGTPPAVGDTLDDASTVLSVCHSDTPAPQGDLLAVGRLNA